MRIQHYVAANANPVRPDEATLYRHLVTYADHVAAVAEAEQRVRDNPDWTNPVLLDEIDRCTSITRKEVLQEAREAVAALATERELRSPSGLDIDIHEALAAIDALGKEGE